MSRVRSLGRGSLASGALLAAVLTIPAIPAGAQEASEAPPSPSMAPVVSPTPATSPVPSGVPSGSPAADIAFSPLPPSVAVIAPDIPTVSVEPESTDDLAVGQSIGHSLGHCGLWSPIDLDGSIWQAIGGAKADGSAIVEGDDAEIGELINATPGVFVLVDEDRAHFTTETGTILELVRAPGAVDFPLCM